MQAWRLPLLPLMAGLVLAGLPLIAPVPASARNLGSTPLPAGGFSAAAPVTIDPAATPKAKPKKKASAPVVHERVVARNDKRPSFHPQSIEAINEAARKYVAIAQAGGWPILPKDAAITAASEGELVLMLRQRLAAEGDLAADETAKETVDPGLIAAVKRFQGRHGQSQNGLVSGATLTELRVPAQERVRQLEESARRLTARTGFNFAARHVVVNIPSASVEAIDNGVVEKRFVAVVGKKDRASPEVETRITNVNLNPTWTVPVSIVKKDIIPKMRKDPGYLAKAKIRIFGASGNEIPATAIDWNTERATAFNLRQESGSGNALGQLRIDMPNRESVYMHDTPSKRLFGLDNRFQSSGCVRVENVRDLAAWILEGQKGWDRAGIDAAIATNARKDIRPASPIPVVWTYLTGYVTPDGIVHFRRDIYGLDSGEVLNATGEAKPVRRAQAEPVTLDSAGLAARAAEASRAPVQRIDP